MNKTSAEGSAGGGLRIAGKNLIVHVQDSVIQSNSATQGGGLHCSMNASIQLVSVIFQMNEALWGGAALVSEPGKTVVLKYNKLLSNRACLGGAVYAVGLSASSASGYNLLMDRTICTENMALIAGGVIYTDVVGLIAVSCNISDSVNPEILPVDENFAEVLATKCSRLWKLNTVAKKGFGNIVASPSGSKLVVRPLRINHRSGEILSPISFRCTDLFKQIVPFNNIFAELEATGLTLSGQKTCTIFEGTSAQRFKVAYQGLHTGAISRKELCVLGR